MAARRARRASPTRRDQHFLRGSGLAAAIVDDAGVEPGDLVLDLGAGTGVLSRELVRRRARVVAVELDPALAHTLAARVPAARVVEEDARTVPLPAEPFLVVANLPFGATTDILRRLLDPRVPLRRADVIVQWELAAKRAAVWPSTLLGVHWSAWHELAVVRRLPPCVFAPPPAVDAAVLRAVRRAEPLVPERESREYERFLRAGFRHGVAAVVRPRERKRLAGELGFDRAARPRDLDARQWAALYRGSVRRRL